MPVSDTRTHYQSVSIPRALRDEVRRKYPELNVSAFLQMALRELVNKSGDRLEILHRLQVMSERLDRLEQR